MHLMSNKFLVLLILMLGSPQVFSLVQTIKIGHIQPEWLLGDLKDLGILLEALKNQQKRIQHTQLGIGEYVSYELDSQFYGRGNCRKFQIL